MAKMETTATYIQSPNRQVEFGNTNRVSTRIISLALATYALWSVCVAPCCVTDAAVLQEDTVAILRGPLGPGGVPHHGSRPGVSRQQRSARRDAEGNKHLTTPDAPAPSNGSSSSTRQRVNDRFLTSLETTDRNSNGTAAADFLRQVTPPHWGHSDPWQTDPTRPPPSNTTTTVISSYATPPNTNSTTTTIRNTTLSNTNSTTTISNIIPANTNSTTTISNTTPSNNITTAIGTNTTEIQQSTIPSTTASSTSLPQIFQTRATQGRVAISSTVKVIFPGATTTTTEVGNIVQDNVDETGTNDAQSKNRTDPPVEYRQGRYLFFNCWNSSHIHRVNTSHEPKWVTDIGKPYVFPALLLVSLIFTSVALLLHILIPDLRANMGKIFMCYILSLWLKCITTPSSLFLGLCAPDFEMKEETCIAIAFVSYMLSLAYRFWLNIMCFDIWRKVSNLVRLEHVRPVKLLYYHLWGWGMPALFGLLALLIREFGPSNVIKPGFMNDGQCWFDQAEAIHQFLYMTLPGGFLHIANIGFVIKTRQNCSLMQQTSIPEVEENSNASVGRIHATTNYINEFNLQFRILNFMIGLWVLWSFSLLIQFLSDMWQFKVIPGFLISLQGLIIFLIFISNNHKRQLIQRKFPFLKRNHCCFKLEHKTVSKQQSSSISEASSERRKKVSVMSITSLTSLFGSSLTAPIEDIAEQAPAPELSSASYNNTSEGGSVHLNFSIHRKHSLPLGEDTHSLNGETMGEEAMSFDRERQKSNIKITRKLCHIPDVPELTLDPSNLILSRTLSCPFPQPNSTMDVNPVTVPESNILDYQTESYVGQQFT